MEKVLRKFIFLTDEQYGQIVRMCLKYSANEEITETDGTPENIIFFHFYVKKELDKVLKARERTRKRKEAKQNEN